MDAVAEIKAKISIEDLVSQYVPLKRVGRQFRALCPFHKERTPSFYVNPERQMAYCFGCRKGGDHFKFIQEMEGLDFRAALEMLAERAGVKLPRIKPQDFQKKTQKDRLTEIHETACAFFMRQLHEGEGEKVLHYLKKRGLKEETIHQARLGFAPQGSDVLYKYLLEQKFTKEEILASGMVIARDIGASECVDRFRMRLMFPIENISGGVCAFGGRAVKEGDQPKYLNSPETALYHKSSILYGLSRARADIRRLDSVIIVEGYMDALAAHQAGFGNVVACSGTALTEDHFLILKRFTKNLFLCFDRDPAGNLATLRSIEAGFDSEFSLKVIVWKSDAKDPDECLREDKVVFSEALKSAKSATVFLLENFKAQYGADSATGKNQIMESMLPFLTRVKSPLLLDEWLKEIALALDFNVPALYDELKHFQKRQKPHFLAGSSTSFSEAKREQEPGHLVKSYEYLLGLLLTYPESRVIANQLMPPEQIEDIELQNIYRSLTTEYNQTLGADSKEPTERANFLAMYAETLLADMTHEAVIEEVKSTITGILRSKVQEEKKMLLAQMKSMGGGKLHELLDSYQALLEREKILWQKS